METHDKKDSIRLDTLVCDSRRCMKCTGGLCEERFEDNVFGVGP